MRGDKHEPTETGRCSGARGVRDARDFKCRLLHFERSRTKIFGRHIGRIKQVQVGI
ncbi:Uncharacterised protein [Mycobacterium tuberculosis]|nr:Uncharacterised protein [Mycobacterium tuberculosis]